MDNKPLLVLKSITMFIFSVFNRLSWTKLSGFQTVQWGNLRRLKPFSRAFGFDRGTPIDRYYIANFLQKHKVDIFGNVLEIGDSEYTRKYGGGRVTRSDVLHAVTGNPLATIVGDLSTGEGIPANTFDCIILVQTLNVIYDTGQTLENCYKALKLGGSLLVTLPGISQISRYDMDRWGDYWRFTDASAKRVFREVFGEENISVETYGNVLVACAYLYGLSAHELKKEELDHQDPDYQVSITVRAVKTYG
jgi:SAM-dependent methyltransferase